MAIQQTFYPFPRLPTEVRLQIWEVACGGGSPPRVIPILPDVAHLSPVTHRSLAYPALLATCRESRAVALAVYKKGTFHPKLWLRKPGGVSWTRRGTTSTAAVPASGSGASVHQNNEDDDEDDGDMIMIHVRFPHQLIDPYLYKGLRWGDDAETVSRRRQWWADRASREAAARDVRRFQQPATASLARGREPSSRRQQQATGATATIGGNPTAADAPARPSSPSRPPPKVRLAAYLDDIGHMHVRHGPDGLLTVRPRVRPPGGRLPVDFYARPTWVHLCSDPAGISAPPSSRWLVGVQDQAHESPQAQAARRSRPRFLPFSDEFVYSVRFPPGCSSGGFAHDDGGNGGAAISDVTLLILPPLTERPDPVTHRIEIVADNELGEALKEHERWLNEEWQKRVSEHAALWLWRPEAEMPWQVPRIRLRFATVTRWEDLPPASALPKTTAGTGGKEDAPRDTVGKGKEKAHTADPARTTAVTTGLNSKTGETVPPLTGTFAAEPPLGLGPQVVWERGLHACGTAAALSPYGYEASGRPFFRREWARCLAPDDLDEILAAEAELRAMAENAENEALAGVESVNVDTTVDDEFLACEHWPYVKTLRFNGLRSW